MLFNHNADKPIGRVINPQIVDGRGVADIEFDDDEFSEMIRCKVARGTLRGISVGYMVTDWEDVSAGKMSTCGRFEGPCSIARAWCPLEISIVSVPADPTVGVGRSMEEDMRAAYETRMRQYLFNISKLGGRPP